MPDIDIIASWANILAIPLAIIGALILPIWIYKRSIKKPALACRIDPTEFPIEIKSGEALEGNIEIRYKGQPVENLSFVRINLKNTGKMAIRKDHVVEDVTFSFGEGTKILRVPQVLHRKPENLKVNWTLADQLNSVSLQFDLLNPGDHFAAEIWCTGNNTVPKIAARIENVNEIELLTPEKTELKRQLNRGLMILAAFIATVVLIGFISFTDDNLAANYTTSFIIAMSICIAVFLWGIFFLIRLLFEQLLNPATKWFFSLYSPK